MSALSPTHLKHEHMPPSRYWADQDGVQDLVIFFTLSRTHIDDFPLKVYKEQRAHSCLLTLSKHRIYFLILGFSKGC